MRLRTEARSGRSRIGSGACPTTSDRSASRFPQAVLDDLRDRLGRTRWPDQIPSSGWGYGTDLGYLRELCETWRTTYDWRAQEARFNQWPHFLTDIDGEQVHFIHARSPEPDAFPLVITHGWPGSVSEFLDIIDPLCNPRAHGGDPKTRSTSCARRSRATAGRARRRNPAGMSLRVANAWKELMARLGYERYGAQGGDWGAIISATLATIDDTHVAGLHSNMLLAFPANAGELSLTEDEAADLAAAGEFMQRGARIRRSRARTRRRSVTGSPTRPRGSRVGSSRSSTHGPTTTVTSSKPSRATRSSPTSPSTGSPTRSTRRCACTANRAGPTGSVRSVPT